MGLLINTVFFNFAQEGYILVFDIIPFNSLPQLIKKIMINVISGEDESKKSVVISDDK